MLSNELKENLIVEIRRVELSLDYTYVEQNAIFSSKVLTLNDDTNTIDIAIPTFQEEPYNLERNVRYSFLFIYESGVMKTAHGVFLQRIRIDNVQMCKIKLVTSLRRIQRRDFFRISCGLDILFQVVSMRMEDVHKPNILFDIIERLDMENWSKGQLIDISGGGIKFASETAILDLPFIFIRFDLPFGNNIKHVGLTGKLLDKKPVPRTLLCTYRVQFMPQGVKAQDDIIAYIYDQQRKIAQKELK